MWRPFARSLSVHESGLGLKMRFQKCPDSWERGVGRNKTKITMGNKALSYRNIFNQMLLEPYSYICQ